MLLLELTLGLDQDCIDGRWPDRHAISTLLRAEDLRDGDFELQEACWEYGHYVFCLR